MDRPFILVHRVTSVSLEEIRQVTIFPARMIGSSPGKRGKPNKENEWRRWISGGRILTKMAEGGVKEGWLHGAWRAKRDGLLLVAFFS